MYRENDALTLLQKSNDELREQNRLIQKKLDKKYPKYPYGHLLSMSVLPGVSIGLSSSWRVGVCITGLILTLISIVYVICWSDKQ